MEMASERHEMTTAFAGVFTELPGEPAYLWLFNFTSPTEGHLSVCDSEFLSAATDKSQK